MVRPLTPAECALLGADGFRQRAEAAGWRLKQTRDDFEGDFWCLMDHAPTHSFRAKGYWSSADREDACEPCLRKRLGEPEVAAKPAATPASPAPPARTCQSLPMGATGRCGKPATHTVLTGEKDQWSICKACLARHRQVFDYEFDGLQTLPPLRDPLAVPLSDPFKDWADSDLEAERDQRLAATKAAYASVVAAEAIYEATQSKMLAIQSVLEARAAHRREP